MNASSHQRHPEGQIEVRRGQRIPPVPPARTRRGAFRHLAKSPGHRVEHRFGHRQQACHQVCPVPPAESLKRPLGFRSSGLLVSSTVDTPSGPTLNGAEDAAVSLGATIIFCLGSFCILGSRAAQIPISNGSETAVFHQRARPSSRFPQEQGGPTRGCSPGMPSPQRCAPPGCLRASTPDRARRSNGRNQTTARGCNHRTRTACGPSRCVCSSSPAVHRYFLGAYFNNVRNGDVKLCRGIPRPFAGSRTSQASTLSSTASFPGTLAHPTVMKCSRVRLLG